MSLRSLAIWWQNAHYFYGLFCVCGMIKLCDKVTTHRCDGDGHVLFSSTMLSNYLIYQSLDTICIVILRICAVLSCKVSAFTCIDGCHAVWWSRETSFGHVGALPFHYSVRSDPSLRPRDREIWPFPDLEFSLPSPDWTCRSIYLFISLFFLWGEETEVKVSCLHFRSAGLGCSPLQQPVPNTFETRF